MCNYPLFVPYLDGLNQLCMPKEARGGGGFYGGSGRAPKPRKSVKIYSISLQTISVIAATFSVLNLGCVCGYGVCVCGYGVYVCVCVIFL